MLKILLIVTLLIAGSLPAMGQYRYTLTPYSGPPTYTAGAQRFYSPYTGVYIPRYFVNSYHFSRVANPYYQFYIVSEDTVPHPETLKIEARIDSLLREIDKSIKERRNLYK